MPIISLAATITAAVATPHGVKQERWNSYENARFGTVISYPARLLRARTEPVNSDGVTFSYADGARLLVYGQHILEGVTPSQPRAFLAWASANERGVTYRTSGRDFAVMSGVDGGRIFYQRFAFDHAGGVIHSYRLEYPRSLQSRYGPIIPRLSSSLSFRRG